MPAVAEFIVRRLLDVGVRTLFGVPGGGGNLDLIEAAGRAGLPFVLTTTETGGAIAAVAQSEVTGRPGACLTTLGPGATSVVNGVAAAFLERAPIFVFTDNYASTDIGRYQHQALRHHELFAPITVRSLSLAPAEAHRSLEQAFSAIGEPPGGPVHLDCPADFESAGVPTGAADLVPRARPAVEFDHALVRRARRPLLIAGIGARAPNVAAGLRALSERRGIPAMVTYKAKGVLPDDHPWWAGLFTNAAIERAIVDESDLVLAIGLDRVELLPRPWSPAMPVIDLADPVAVEGLLADSAWDPAWLEARVDAQRRAVQIPTAGLSAHRVVEIAAARLARDHRVTVDAGAHMFPATMLWPVQEPNQLLISNGLSTMGFALPAAIGAALADRDRPVVALTGDGGLAMCAGELLTAVRERLRVLTIVFDDTSLSLIEIKQRARRLAPAGVALGAPDWAAVARGFGVAAFVATDDASLGSAIEDARLVSGPSLIQAKVDRSNYGAVLRAIRG